MKLLKYIGYGLAISILSIAITFLVNQKTEPAFGSAYNYGTAYMPVGGGSSTDTAVSTTTTGVTYKAVNATTTFPFYAEHADLVGVTVQMTASTSPGTLYLTYETSNTDASCHTDPNICDWSLPATITSGVAASTSPYTTWRPDGANLATSTLYFTINPATAKFIRVKAWVSGSAAALWMSASRKVQNP